MFKQANAEQARPKTLQGQIWSDAVAAYEVGRRS